MKRLRILAAGVCALTVVAGSAVARPRAASLMPELTFERNEGQAAASVRFLSRGSGYALHLETGGAWLLLHAGGGRVAALRWTLPGARSVEPEGLHATGGVSNYLIGSDPSRWRRRVPHFARVRYRQIYPGIDVIFYGRARSLEFDVVVAPGADPRRFAMRFDCAGPVWLGPDGELRMDLGGAQVVQRKPVIFQERGGRRVPVAGGFRLAGGTVGFDVGAYDPSLPLVIDPILSFSTYLGGNGADTANGMALDSSGNVYVAGVTLSGNFPVTPDSVRSFNVPGFSDAFVAKFNPTGTRLIYATFLGGASNDGANGIAVDAAGGAFVVGTTRSPDFPLRNPLQTAYRGGHGPNDPVLLGDAFVARLNPAGTDLVYSTYLGGSGADQGLHAAVDNAGNCAVSGNTRSTDFPVAGSPTQNNPGGSQDIFIARINANGGALLFSTYFGGSSSEAVNGMAQDEEFALVLGGQTESSNFPVSEGVFQSRNNGQSDGFLMKVSSTGALIFSTYFGDAGSDSIQAVTMSPGRNMVVAGTTNSPRLPVSATALQPNFGGGSSDAFVAGFSATGAGLNFSTFLGGDRSEFAASVAVDRSGNPTVLILSDSLSLRGTPDALVAGHVGGGDIYLARLSPAGSAVSYATFFGGTSLDQPRQLVLDPRGNAYFCGVTNSGNFPTTRDAFRTGYQGGSSDAFVTRITFDVATLTIDALPRPMAHVLGATPPSQSIRLLSTGAAANFRISTASDGDWLQVTPTSGTTPAQLQITVNPLRLVVRSYTGTITVTSAEAANSPFNITVNLTVTAPQSSDIRIAANGFVNGASFGSGAVVPGQIISLFGSGIGPEELVGLQLDAEGRVARSLGGVQLLFDGVPAPLLFVSASQLGAVVPYSVAGRAGTQVQVEFGGVRSNTVLLPVAAAGPGIFTANASGRGSAAALNGNGVLNTPETPAARGSVIVLFATGEGQTDPAGVDGLPAREPLPRPVLPVTVRIDGLDAQVLYAGAAPGLVAGVLQVNAIVPERARAGEVPVVIRAGTVSSQAGVTIAVE